MMMSIVMMLHSGNSPVSPGPLISWPVSLELLVPGRARPGSTAPPERALYGS